MAFDSSMSGQKRSCFVYEESEVKRHPGSEVDGEQRMRVSVALSTKNFASNNKRSENGQEPPSEPSTVRFPLREVNQNLNPIASSLSSV